MVEDISNTSIVYQQEAYRALGGIIERTLQENLPVISWMLGDGGVGPLLVGECHAADPIKRQEDFYTWQAAIGAEAWPNGIKRMGGVHLHASTKDYDGVAVTLSADISAEELDA
ncbi:hypothetical protein ACQPYK_12760 [Streptosporangium sp. CA-135522]|uniref:hypothetical protein n=1 Tax=Streptosporangium sp. CA-135522 TaxID=3240072 RepID=UPI003D913E68